MESSHLQRKKDLKNEKLKGTTIPSGSETKRGTCQEHVSTDSVKRLKKGREGKMKKNGVGVWEEREKEGTKKGTSEEG